MKVNFSIMPSLILFAFVLLIVHTAFNVSFGQQNNINIEFLSNNSALQTTRPQIDTVRPVINITYPNYPLTVTTGKIIIQGTAYDSGSGIHNVSADAHTFPFKGHFPIPLVSKPIPVLPNNWSHWSVPYIINDTGTYRVVITARDNTGNQNYAETTINAALAEQKPTMATREMIPKIAFVRPTFTEAAYQEHGFYRFYFKYGFPPFGKNITTDLDMLTVKTPKSVSEFRANNIKHLSNITSLVPINGTELSDVSQDYFPVPQKFWLPFIDSVKKVVPNATVTVMRDEDVHDGHMFYPDKNTKTYPDGKAMTKNAYDILFLSHNEYVTQQEYDNLKQFVKNGGTIVFIDANALYAEVRYDRNNHTITLVKGHDWQFDGKDARRSVHEKWYNESKIWTGGNYLVNTIESNVTFTNNPFNYTHFEEQFVNNAKDKLMINYGIKFQPKAYFNDPSLWQKQVGTFSLAYGKGKVIMLGLSGRLLAENPEFIKFFEKNILPNALCPKFQSCLLQDPQNDFTPPTINITYPSLTPTITTGKLEIAGNTFDSESGIYNVSAAAYKLTSDRNFPVPFMSAPMPTSNNNWSRWSVPLIINESGIYRVITKATDNAGNANYAEVTINVVPMNQKVLNATEREHITPRISIVRPTFSEGAYQENGFNKFYLKHGFPPYGKKVTKDLDMLTVKTPKSVSEFPGITSTRATNKTELYDNPENNIPHLDGPSLPFIEHVRKTAPNSTVTVIRDEDVHDGHIFYPHDNKTNAYEVLLLFRNEYVTQAEYDNLRQFVKNGGTIVFIDGNVFRGEVNYDKNNSTITLVKGHDWKFDGKAASRSLPERWYNETKEWVGSNYLDIDANVTFTNNPFNYSHSVEQFVNNPNATVMVDYGIKFPKDFIELYSKKEKLPAELQREDIPIESIRVATYSLNFGKGKVIMLGLSGETLAEDPKFMKFFDNTVLPKALCPNIESCTNTIHTTTNYLYGCTNYENFGFHCDTIPNEFENYQVLAKYTKISTVTRQPDYIQAKFGKGVHTTGEHALESLRANIIDAYNSSNFSLYLSFRPDEYDKKIGNPNMTLLSYQNGIFSDDNNTAGWKVELFPSSNSTMKKVRFTVFNTNGEPNSSKDINIPVGKFSEIAGTFDGKYVRIFVNGSLRSETPFAGNYSGFIDHNNYLKVAGDAYCTCYLASGTFDEFRFYNYSLKSQEIGKINSHSDDTLDKGLVGYWKFDGNLKDYSLFKNDMFYNTPISSMAFAPDGRLFYTEKNSGNIRIMINNTVLAKPFASIPDIHVDFEQGLLGIAIDSKFIQNHYVYVFYNYDNYSISPETNVWARIVRFTDVNNSGTNETVIFDKIPASVYGYHTGGALMFDKVDDKLYVTVGDAIDAKRAQNLSSLYGKTLRINRDGTIPDDNPFLNSPVYTYGHRNMYGLAFDDKGNGIVTEPGPDSYDEINSNIRGANYGWPMMLQTNIVDNPLSNNQSIKPLRSYYITVTPTQAVYYNGDMYPELKGNFIVGSFRGDLYAYRTSEDGKELIKEIRVITSVYPSKEVVGVAVSPRGQIYFGAYDIFKLDNLDSTSQEEIMFPIQINATNIKVTDVNYTEQTNRINLDLVDEHGLSDFSIKIPNSIIENSSQYFECNSRGNHLTNNQSQAETPFHLDVREYKNYDIISVEVKADSPNNLRLTISPKPHSSIHSSILPDVCLIGT